MISSIRFLNFYNNIRHNDITLYIIYNNLQVMFHGLQYLDMLEFIVFFTDKNLYNVRKTSFIYYKFDGASMTTSQPLSYKTIITYMFYLKSIEYLLLRKEIP